MGLPFFARTPFIHSFIHLSTHPFMLSWSMWCSVWRVCFYPMCTNRDHEWTIMLKHVLLCEILLFNRHHNYPHLTGYITIVHTYPHKIMVISRPRHTFANDDTFDFNRMRFLIQCLPRTAEIFYFYPDQLLCICIRLIVDPNLGDILTCLQVSKSCVALFALSAIVGQIN